jgi:hypothetical protein
VRFILAGVGDGSGVWSFHWWFLGVEPLDDPLCLKSGGVTSFEGPWEPAAGGCMPMNLPSQGTPFDLCLFDPVPVVGVGAVAYEYSLWTCNTGCYLMMPSVVIDFL